MSFKKYLLNFNDDDPYNCFGEQTTPINKAMNVILAIASVLVFGIGTYNMKMLIQKKRLMRRKSFFLLSFYVFAQITCVSKFLLNNLYFFSNLCTGPRCLCVFYMLPMEHPSLPAFLHDINRC